MTLVTELDPRLPFLTRREAEVLEALCRPALTGDLLAEAASVRQIAQALVVTDAAVKQHLLHLYDKFEIHEAGERRRVRLAKEAIRRGFARPSSAPRPATVMDGEGPLQAGREAYVRRDWRATWALLREADALRPLDADDLELLGEAGYWSDRHDESYVVRQRAHQAYLRAGDCGLAAYEALMLTIHYVNRMEFLVAGGWFAKAQRLLEDEPECAAHGQLTMVTVLFKEAAGDWQGVLNDAAQAYQIGRRFQSQDLQALALAFQGLAMTHLFQVTAGARLLDEAMAAATGGGLMAMTTGLIYCRMLCACLDVQDFGRATQWIRVIERCEESPHLRGLPGDCRLHRAAVYNKHGAWAEASSEAQGAAEEAQVLDLPNAGSAWRELGDIRLQLGDLDGAEAAFIQAHERGITPEPGMSLLRLARGDAAGAAPPLDAVLQSLPAGALARARLLPARVEIALALRDMQTVRTAVPELEGISAACETPALQASAACARGALMLEEGDAAGALERLQASQRLWQRIEAPFEAAKAGCLLAEAWVRVGDRESAHVELRSALNTFERLGAVRAGEQARQSLARLAPS